MSLLAFTINSIINTKRKDVNNLLQKYNVPSAIYHFLLLKPAKCMISFEIIMFGMITRSSIYILRQRSFADWLSCVLPNSFCTFCSVLFLHFVYCYL